MCASGGGEPQPSSDVVALRAGARVRPFGRRFHVFLGWMTLHGLVFLAAGIAAVFYLGPSSDWKDASAGERYLFGGFATALGIGLLTYTWGTKLHVAVEVSASGLAYWDWRNRLHEVRWDEVTRVDWHRAYRRICKWHLSLRYLPRYSLERRTRGLRLPTADGWRPEIAEALRDEIVARSGLRLAEGDPDKEGDKVWRQPDSGP